LLALEINIQAAIMVITTSAPKKIKVKIGVPAMVEEFMVVKLQKY
jgi:hypothetical protein